MNERSFNRAGGGGAEAALVDGSDAGATCDEHSHVDAGTLTYR